MTTTSRPAGELAHVNGLAMYYEVHGTGHPLVLLHGGLLSIELSFGAMIPSLAASQRVIAVELQGHGRTADIDREPSIPAMADDVVALLDHLGIAGADVFGFSLGGLVALELAVRHPERADRLVLASAHHGPDGYHDDIGDPAENPGSVRMPTADEFAQMREEYVRLAPDPGHFDAFAEKLGTVVHTHPGWLPDDLRRVSAPTLVVIGDTDFVRIEHATEMFDLIPDAQLAVIPATRHTEVTGRTEVDLPMVKRYLAR